MIRARPDGDRPLDGRPPLFTGQPRDQVLTGVDGFRKAGDLRQSPR